MLRRVISKVRWWWGRKERAQQDARARQVFYARCCKLGRHEVAEWWHRFSYDDTGRVSYRPRYWREGHCEHCGKFLKVDYTFEDLSAQFEIQDFQRGIAKW